MSGKVVSIGELRLQRDRKAYLGRKIKVKTMFGTCSRVVREDDDGLFVIVKHHKCYLDNYV